MREIAFRRCRLEIEPSGIVRTVKDGQVSADMAVSRDRLAEVGAAACGFDDLLTYHVNHKIAVAWLWDVFDEDFVEDADVRALLCDEPNPKFGQWDIMLRFWFSRVCAGAETIQHGRVINAATFTSLFASAIKADRDADNRDEGRDATVDGEDVSGTD
jgi:hypothetical protein